VGGTEASPNPLEGLKNLAGDVPHLVPLKGEEGGGKEDREDEGFGQYLAKKSIKIRALFEHGASEREKRMVGGGSISRGGQGLGEIDQKPQIVRGKETGQDTSIHPQINWAGKQKGRPLHDTLSTQKSLEWESSRKHPLSRINNTTEGRAREKRLLKKMKTRQVWAEKTEILTRAHKRALVQNPVEERKEKHRTIVGFRGLGVLTHLTPS